MIAAPYRTAWKLYPPASRQRVRPAPGGVDHAEYGGRMSAQNGRWKDRMSQSDLDAVDRGIPATAPRGKGSQTLRWREMDSNHRYRIRNNPFGYPVRSRNSPSATKTGSFVPGTDGSNPFPSSRESAANLTSEGIAGQHNAMIARSVPHRLEVVRQAAPCQASRVVKPGVFAEAAKGRGERRRGHGAQAIRTPAFADLWRSSQVMAGAVLT